MDHRVRGRFTEYKVRWKGFGPKDDSWVPEAELNCDTLLNKYFKTAGAKQEEVYEVGMRCCSHLYLCFIINFIRVIVANSALVSTFINIFLISLFIFHHYLILLLFFFPFNKISSVISIFYIQKK